MDRLDAALTHWAQHTPDAIAVRFGGNSFTYRELEAATESVAGGLVKAGVAPGDRVAVHTNKGFPAIAAVFGALRAGAVYVPIDPAAPKARVEKILTDCGVRCVLVDPQRNASGTQTRNFIDISDAIAQNARVQAVARSTDDLAYILYTSGSTGAPKGICHTHKSGMAYARMSAELCRLAPSDRVSHHTPLHFDMSIFDVFATVLAGATIVVIPEMHAKMPASLSQLIQKEGVTVWYSVPFAMSQLVSRGCLHERDFSALRVVMFAGEVMPPRTLAEFAKHASRAELLNAYGPTETNHCLTARIDRTTLDGDSPLPIGHPDEGIKARINTAGELLIAGDQVMAGYWKDPLRTSKAMINAQDNAQYYNTGDVVTQRRDGQFMLVGRSDRQVKIRGYRVELDEIERVLGVLPAIEEIALAYDAENDVLKAAFSGSATADLLRTHALDNLPSYMVPQEIVQVPALVRTSTGKIDRRQTMELYSDRFAA